MKIYRQGAWQTLYDFPVEINWGLTDMCNYKCSYCFGQRPVEPGRFSTLEDITSAVEKIAALNRPHYVLTLSGGEPTIHPHFFDVIKLCHEKIGSRLEGVIIISNGSRSGELYNRICDIANNINIVLNISLHSEYVEMEHISELVCKLSEKVTMNFSIMVNPSKWEVIRNITNIMSELVAKYPIKVHLELLRNPPDFSRWDDRYTQSDFEFVREMNKELSAHNNGYKNRLNNYFFDYYYECVDEDGRQIIDRYGIQNNPSQSNEFKGMYCIAGSSMINIKHDGICYGAVCDAASTQKNIFIENPFTDDWIRCIKCPMEACGCDSNHKIPKFRDKLEADRFVQICRQKQRGYNE